MHTFQNYPYFVIRHFATLYEKRPCNQEAEKIDLIEDIREIAFQEKKEACVVFGENDVVYVEPDGTFEFSDSPPQGRGLA